MSDNVGFVVDKWHWDRFLSAYFGFPYQFSFHQLLHTHLSSSGGDKIGSAMAGEPSGLSLTALHEIKINKLSETVPVNILKEIR
jgi:hypothetical protein